MSYVYIFIVLFIIYIVIDNFRSKGKEDNAGMDNNYYNSDGTTSVDQIMSDLRITRNEMNRLLQANGINTASGYLSQAQVDAVYDSYFSYKAGMSSQSVSNPVSQSVNNPHPVMYSAPSGSRTDEVLPSVIINDYTKDRVNACSKYNNKYVSFYGSILTPADKQSEEPLIELQSNDPKFQGVIKCYFPKLPAESKVFALMRTNYITISGYISDVYLIYNHNQIILKKCCIYSGSSAQIKPQTNKTASKVQEPKSAKDHKVAVQAMTTIPDTKILRPRIPALGDKVYASGSGSAYTLVKEIGGGGEGTVYALDQPGMLAKIYNEKSCTAKTREKIKLMAGLKLNYKGICLPVEVLNDSYGNFTGFTMPEAKGQNLNELLGGSQLEFEQNFPNWKKLDLVKLAITILRKIKYLHKKDILMGDISLNNIMFVSPDEVYFIDTDSYQCGPFPCTVGTPDFVAPELLGRDLKTVMRTEGNENFAIATLLFMIMMNGKQPYSHKGGSQSAADIKAMIFPYGAGERPVPGGYENYQPEGLWRYLWSHLLKDLKFAFIDNFRKDGKNNTEQTRFSVHDWLRLMESYCYSLPKYMIANDTMSNNVFPTREKHSKDVNYLICQYCGEMKSDDNFYDQNTCYKCHNEIRNQVHSTIICSVCGTAFTITNGEYEFYTSNGLNLPKRCKNCR